MPKSDDLKASDFTLGEKFRLAGLGARALKCGLADDGTGNVDISDLQRRVERIENKALRRKNKK